MAPALVHFLEGSFKDSLWLVEILRVDEEGIFFSYGNDQSKHLITNSDFASGRCRFLPSCALTDEPLPKTAPAVDNKFGRYLQALGLSDMSPETTLELPVTSEPTLSMADSIRVSKWAKSRFSVMSRPDVINLKDISFTALHEYTKWEEPPPDSCRKALLQGAIKHLRERVDDRNRRNHTHVEGQELIHCSPETILEEIKTSYGLTGYSYMLCYAKHLLGLSGEDMVKDLLKQLRSTKDADSIRSLTYEECVELANADETLAKLIFVSLQQAARDVDAKQKGESCEEAFEKILGGLGISRTDYYTEDDLREIQIRLFEKVHFPTPDVLFKKQVLLNGSPVRWIDVKNTLAVPGCTMPCRYDKLLKQVEKYNSWFSGNGVVMWRFGWAATLPQSESVRYLQLVEGSGLWEGESSSG
jgi:hypothetical protein